MTEYEFVDDFYKYRMNWLKHQPPLEVFEMLYKSVITPQEFKDSIGSVLYDKKQLKSLIKLLDSM